MRIESLASHAVGAPAALHTAADALKLPRGQLFLEPQCVEFHFTEAMVLAAADQCVRRRVPFEFATQAQVLSHAQGGSEDILHTGTKQLVRAVPTHATAYKRVYTGGVCQLAHATDALKLPRGSLELGVRLGTARSPNGTLVPVPVKAADVLACAKILIAKGDTRPYRTQADVIAIAGNAYDWGAGHDYYPSRKID